MRKFQTQDWYPTSSQPYLPHMNRSSIQLHSHRWNSILLRRSSILCGSPRKTETTSIGLGMLVPHSYPDQYLHYIHIGVTVVVEIDEDHQEREATEVEKVAVVEAVTEVIVEAMDVGEEYRNRPQKTGAAGTMETLDIGNLNTE
ncbi:hypothetical protein L873DRAFT_1888851, partial [Choiromyces venosus 120613-1]